MACAGALGGYWARPRLDPLIRRGPVRVQPAPAGVRIHVSDGATPAGFLSVAPPDQGVPAAIDPAWQDGVRGSVLDLLRVPARTVVSVRPEPRPVALAPESADIEERWQRLELDDGQSLRVAVLRPHGSTAKATVLCLHGHGRDGIVPIFDVRDRNRGVGTALAGAGYEVVAVETRGFGESRVAGIDHVPYVHRLRLQGHEFHGQVLADNVAVLDWLEREGVIEGRVGVEGLSMGGLAAMFLALRDPRVEVLLAAGSGGSWRHSFASVSHCCCSILPGLLERADAAPILAASHARRVALEVGENDDALGLANVARDVDLLRSIRGRGGPSVEVIVIRGGHEHDAKAVVGFFDECFE